MILSKNDNLMLKRNKFEFLLRPISLIFIFFISIVSLVAWKMEINDKISKIYEFSHKKTKIIKIHKKKSSNKHDEKFHIFKFNTLIDFMSLII